MVDSSTRSPSILMGCTSRGWRIRRTSRRRFLVKITSRMLFTPPAVLPAQAPVIIRRNKISWLMVGQRAKSVVA